MNYYRIIDIFRAVKMKTFRRNTGNRYLLEFSAKLLFNTRILKYLALFFIVELLILLVDAVSPAKLMFLPALLTENII
jgi:hypothetical protein